ncbi:hypothetical protein HU200_066565 [Digitaria exilis]|uniref:Uncharacterized protein n=1 Tax=Digitaria exilis TaxID=1010633 RepID=A0A835DWJ7_9POAL|nr:hypothetical protein HU200_066565 [Digitaria exilis]
MATADAAPPAGSGRDHVVVFPLMAKGHMLPLFHFATALAAHHGLRVTVVTTHGNLAFARHHLLPSESVSLAALPFPSHPELPPGVESKDALPSLSLFPAFLRATAMLAEPFAGYLASLPSPPLAVVSDFFLAFTQRVATDAGVRRITFHGMSTFALALSFYLARRTPTAKGVVDGGAPFRVPGFPEGVTITGDDVPDSLSQAEDDPLLRFMFDEILNWEYRSWGILVNSFDALDGEYAAVLESLYLPGTRAWLVGPLFLLAAGVGESSQEEESDEDPEGCLPWLDEQAPGSVVYVSGRDAIPRHRGAARRALARACRLRPRLPVERPVVHRRRRAVVAAGESSWQGRRRRRRRTAAARSGSPGGGRDANAKQVAEIIGAGARVRAKAGSGEVVGRAHVAEKVRELMDAGEAGRRMRDRAEQVKQAARAAVGEGGTSRLALRRLVDELRRSGGQRQ